MTFRWMGTVRQAGDLVAIIESDDATVCQRETDAAAATARLADLGPVAVRLTENRPSQGRLF